MTRHSVFSFLLLALTAFATGCEDTVIINDIEPPTIKVHTDRLDFGTVNIGERTTKELRVSNTGDSSLQISELSVHPGDYIFGVDGPTSLAIHPGETIVVTVYFWPTAIDQYTASLKIYSDADNSSVVLVNLDGEAETFCRDCLSPPESVCLPSGDLLRFLEEGECQDDGECEYTAVVDECDGECDDLTLQCVEGDPDGGTAPPPPVIEADAGPSAPTETEDAGVSTPNPILDAGSSEPPCVDTDADGVCNIDDNCPGAANTDQADSDNDGVGDVCDLCIGHDDTVDTDGDVVPDGCDNCPNDSNQDQANSDTDSFGDVCDNCPNVSNQDQANSDTDAFGDVCDNCPSDSNQDQTNSDGDSLGDVCDNCPMVDNEDQPNSDMDSFGDACDNCPNTENPSQTNSDGDSWGDACDNCQNTDNENQTNSDNDDWGDVCDNCVEVTNPDQANVDADAAGDACDNCPSDEFKIEPGVCGCGVTEDDTDSDSDGTLNCVDGCPDDSEKIAPGDCGCGEVDQPDCGGLCFDTMSRWVPPDADAPLDESRFSRQTGSGANGNPDPDEPIVIDALTQLQWQGCLMGLRGVNCETSTTATGSGYAAETYNTHRTGCEYSQWGGYGDWRLPSVQELTSIPDYYYASTALPSGYHFPELAGYVWSKTESYPGSGYVFTMNFDSTQGYGGLTYISETGAYIELAALCVREGSTDNRCFEVDSSSGEEVIRDPSTQLMWQESYWGSNGSSWSYNPGDYAYDSYPITDICGENTFGGYSDWRMPTITELTSLMYFDGDTGVGFPTDVFDTPTLYNDCIWSKSLAENGNYTNRFVYNHTAGVIEVNDSDSDYCYVRCVRDDTP